MATFNFNIESHNTALTDEGGREHEIARLLRVTAERIENGEDSGNLRDINGATVGTWSMDLPSLQAEGDDDDDEEG